MATKCTCDICGKDRASHVRTLVYRTFDGSDGKSFFEKPCFCEENIDLCEDCMAKATNIHSIGVMCREYAIDPIKK